MTNKLTALRNVVTGKFGRQILRTKKHAPLIMFSLGAAGVIAAAVVACRATLKVEKVLDEIDEKVAAAKELHEEDPENFPETLLKKETSKAYFTGAAKIAKLYAPAVVIGAASIASLTGSHVMLQNRFAGAAAAYAALEKGYRSYRARVKEKYGEDQDREFLHGYEEIEIVEEALDGSGPVIKTMKRAAAGGEGIHTKWFDEGSRNWTKETASNLAYLEAQQNHWNWKLNQDGYVMLNDVLQGLDLPRFPEGQLVGWVKDADKTGKGDGLVSFGIFEGATEGARDFMNGWNKAVKLNFNIDPGLTYTLI
jgi:hypothetical protein